MNHTTKHTPGPWLVAEQTQYNNRRAVCADNGYINVCVCFGTVLSDEPDHPMNAIRDANARLIAAAPSLLSALQLCCHRLSEYPDAIGGIALEGGLAAIAKTINQ